MWLILKMLNEKASQGSGAEHIRGDGADVKRSGGVKPRRGGAFENTERKDTEQWSSDRIAEINGADTRRS